MSVNTGMKMVSSMKHRRPNRSMNTSNLMMRSMNVNSGDFKQLQQPLYMEHSDSSNVKLFDRRNVSLSPKNFETEPGVGQIIDYRNSG